MREVIKTCIIGPGNVGSHMFRWLSQSDVEVIQVLSRKKEHPIIPAHLICCDPGKLTQEADIYFVCLRDSNVEKFISSAKGSDGLWVHCSGTLPQNIFEGIVQNYGVFYPLQTFSKDIDMEYKQIPLLLESNSTDGLLLMQMLASKMSEHIEVCSTAERKTIHLAAVFANNFLNHTLTAADDIIGSSGTSFSLLHELIKQTVSKALEAGPEASQTGPAMRGDHTVMEEHMMRLKEMGRWSELYQSISKSIQTTYTKNNGDTD